MFAPAVALAFGMAGAAAQAADPVIEFYNANLDHYFVTISRRGGRRHRSWRGRTGLASHGPRLRAYADALSAPPDAVPVCRFYGNVADGGPNSHFYTADPLECAAVKRDPGWHFEGIAFHAMLPVGAPARPPRCRCCATATAASRKPTQSSLHHRRRPP
ncbi:MAG: hypothetical protein IPI73_25080 [Betaproteobacteria bacterium]|nr:hypothetical protein [Betaproteobacteria bacterium]